MDGISVLIITRNEAGNLKRCLESVARVAEEVVVVDSGSTDDTVQIARHSGARVFIREWEGYSSQKNYAQDQAKFDFVLSLDADEALSPELANSIMAEKSRGLRGAYTMNRLNRYQERWIRSCGWYPDRKIRLWNRRQGRWEGSIHEELKLAGGITVRHLTGDLLHYSFKDRADFLERTRHYAELSAQDALAKGKKASIIRLLANPAWRFFKDFILNKGFLDGRLGWEICRINAYGTFLKYQLLRDLTTRGRLE